MESSKEPKVSIVLPVYNGERYLAEAIDSIVAQTLTDWELILVNDCSSDSTRQIASRYADKDSRIRIIDHEVNLRVPKSLNEGFEAAKGKYYTWTSDDNILHPEMLESLANELDSKQYVGFAFSNFNFIDENGKVIIDKRFGDRKRLGSVADVVDNGYGASFLFKKELVDTVGIYDPDMYLCEEYDYALRTYCRGVGVSFVPRVLYSFRLHGESQTSTKQSALYDTTLSLIRKYYWDLFGYTRTYSDRAALFDHMYRFCDKEERRRLRRSILEMNLWLVGNTFRKLFKKG